MTQSYHYNENLFVRPPEPGMGLAVARRTVFRKRCACGTEPWASEEKCPKCGTLLDESTCENWGDVATRVALGNSLIHPSGAHDLLGMERHIAAGTLLTSGRHLQHGDRTQPGRGINVFSNCSTAATSAEKFYLLLSGSGVGRCYDDDVMLVDWRRMPEVRCVLSPNHPDFDPEVCDSTSAASHGLFVAATARKEGALIEFDLSGSSTNGGVTITKPGKDYYYFVEDSREGWGRAIELLESMAYEGWSHRVLVLDFSFVRAKGQPIAGMQHRPSAGPVPTIKAIRSIREMAERARSEGWPEWKQTLYVDHYLADCVHLGGARRAARISIKHWRDPGIAEYCRIKQAGGLWTANMSVGLDEEFYDCLAAGDPWACLVADAIVDGQYVDLTGEPGSINQHRLHVRTDQIDELSAKLGGNYPKLTPMMARLRGDLHARLMNKKWIFITNPCQPGFATVLTPEGIKTFDDIDVGSTIWSGKRWTKVTAKMATGTKPVYRFRTTAGAFIGTRDHRVVSEGVKIPVGECESIDRVRGGLDSEVDLNPQDIMDGWVMGDGSVHKASNNLVYLCVGKKDGDILVDLKDWVLEPRPGLGAYAYEVDTTIEAKELPKTYEREVPRRFFHGDAAKMRGFLRGLYSANGSIVSTRITLKATSFAIISSVQQMLSALGIGSYYTTNKTQTILFPNGEYETKQSFDLNITSDRSRFRKLIGFVQHYKQAALNEICDAKRSNRGSRNTFDITSIEFVGDLPVYDITVEADEHTYWTGGLLVSNCSEISLLITGGYCIVMDVAPCNIPKLDGYYCHYRGVPIWGSDYVSDLGYEIQEDFEDAVRHAARACIRTNLLPAHFQGEVQRTNRIGISLAGVHEYAWKRFGFTFRDLLDESKSQPFWDSLASARRALHDECVRYSEVLGVAAPHTESAFKPGGSVPKIHGLSECANLPSLPYMIRWVQFAKGDPRVAEYEAAGYPVKRGVRSYEMSEIVGFPTQMPIAEMMGDKLVTAGDATPEEHYQWLRLLEKYWIVGVEEDGTPMEDRGNQVAYTLKFDPKKVSRQEWFETWRRNQASVRCCAVMPQVDATAYAYQPEEPITRETYEEMISKIRASTEVFDPETSSCTMGACPL